MSRMDAGRVTSAALSVLTEAMGEHIAGGYGRFLSSAMQPIPGECLEDFDEAASETENCIPIFWNHLVVSAATPKITQELRRRRRDVSGETYYTVELYNVVSSDKGAVHENQLRVLPQDCVIHTIIDQPNQNRSSYTPKLTVHIVDIMPTPREGRVTSEVSAARRVQRDGIPGMESFSFGMKVSDSWTLTRHYYRHVPQGVPIKGILIQYHSWRKTCESWERRHKPIPLADKYGLILIIACGSEYGWYSSVFKSISGWNAGICCTKRQDIDDVEYTRIIIKRENKNNLPVFGYGLSNGGMMVESLLCHKVIQMAVSVNGVLALNPGLQGSFKTCDNLYNDASLGPKPPVPRVASIHCLDDDIVPYNGSLGYPKPRRFLSTYFATNLLPRTNRDISRWAGRVGCKKKETTKTKIAKWTRLKEWKCPAKKSVVSIKRIN
ncbi:hypothetical protein FOZ63_031248, partial [Perkinsus olseni]